MCHLIEEEKWLTDQDTKEKGVGAWTLVYKKIDNSFKGKIKTNKHKLFVT